MSRAKIDSTRPTPRTRYADTNQLRAGVVVVYRTSEGLLGKLQILANEGDELRFRYTTYTREGTVHHADEDAVVAPTYTFDLDGGGQTAHGSDIWWEWAGAHGPDLREDKIWLTPRGGVLSLYGIAPNVDGKPPEPTQPPERFPDGIDPAQTSSDATYGTKNHPIEVGGPEGTSGPESSQLYLRHLRDSAFRPFRFERIGSFGEGPDGHVIDGYELSSETDGTRRLFIDMYHPDRHPFSVQAPKGSFFFK